jgi:hypothetical protein
MPTLNNEVRFTPLDDDGIRFTPLDDDGIRFTPLDDNEVRPGEVEPTISARAIVPPPWQSSRMQSLPGPAIPRNTLEMEQARIREEHQKILEAGRSSEQAYQDVVSGITSPLVNISPKAVARMMPAVSLLGPEAGAGVSEGIAETASGFTSPLSLATVPAAIIAPAPVAGIMAGLGAKTAGEAFGAQSVASEQGNVRESAKLGVHAVAGGSMAALGPLAARVPSVKQQAMMAIERGKIAGLEKSAKALDDLARQTESGPIDLPPIDATVREAMRPSPEALSVPETLRRPNEMQISEPPRMESIGEVGPTTQPRIIYLNADQAVMDALTQYQLAKQRASELGKGGKLETSGDTFSGLEITPKFLETAEQRIANRPKELEPLRDVPVITESTPLKSVETLVREKLEQHDWVSAVAILGQTKTQTSAALVNKLLGVGRESVPLSAAEQTMFNEIWDLALQKAGAPQAVRPEPPNLISRLESLKKPLTPGVGANPFPEIAKAVWNTALDIAIAGINAGQHIKVAIDSAIKHLKRNASGFDEAKVRSYMNEILLREPSISEKAERSTDAIKPALAPPPLEPHGLPVRPLGEPYSEPILERVGRLGKGPVSQAVTREAFQIVDNAKRILGELNESVLDNARRAAGSPFGGTTWMNGIREITPNAAIGRFHEALETHVKTGTWEHVPPEARGLAETLWNANLAIGKLAEQASPGFKATGSLQRMLTHTGMDFIRRGGGRAWEAWAEGLSKANDLPVTKVKAFLRKWKAEIDQPGWDSAKLDRISQDFKRQFPNVVTHVKSLGAWHEVIHSAPFRYLDQAANRTAHAAAFREVYPLLKDENGRPYSSGKLQATRKAVMAEMETDKHAAEFDNLIRALQGHPIDTYSLWWNAPDTPIGATIRALNDAASPIFSAMLSATSFRNIGETISGGAQIFMGYKRALESSIKERKAYSDLERSGMVNRAILDFSYDPTSPVRSLSRQASNLIRKMFAEQISNEFQEFTGAAAARVIANEIREGRLPEGDRQNVIATMRAMGIAYDDAIAAVVGKNEPVVRQFETRAAEFLYGGNRALAESSPLGASRAFTQLFKWHSYPMTKVRQVRSLVNNLIESVERKDSAQIYANALLLGKHIGGTVMAGAITTGIMALINEGLHGVGIKAREAQDDFPEFLWDTYSMAMGGPVQIASRIVTEAGDVNSWITELLNASAPVGVANDLSRAVLGIGPYEGLGTVERIGKFLESKVSMSRAIKRGMASFGLAHSQPELEADIRAFKRWQRDKFGYIKFESHILDDYNHSKFRSHMKKAVEALKTGDQDGYSSAINKALEIESTRKVKRSLRGRKILRRPDGGALSQDDYEDLERRIGSEGIRRIENFDSMLNSL